MDESGSGRLSRWLKAALRHIQIEDVTLALILIATPFVAPITDILPVFGGQNDFLSALVAFLAAVGAIVAMATRVPNANRLDKPTPDEVPVRIWLVGPFIGAVGFVAGDLLDRMGLPGGDALVGIAFVVAAISFIAGKHLPVVSRNTRRLLVGPFVLLSGAFLQQTAADITSSFAGTDVLGQLLALHNPVFMIELNGGPGLRCPDLLRDARLLAPRELADPGASTLSWAIRFAIFYVSLIVAIIAGSSGPLLVA